MAEKATFYLKVLAAEKEYFKGQAEVLDFQTIDGRFQFLAHHEQIMVAVDPGEINIKKADGTWIHAVAGYGSVIFANNRATLLVDTCESPEELDERRAQEALDRAKERLRQKQSMNEYHMTQAAMARALSRLKFKGKYTKE